MWVCEVAGWEESGDGGGDGCFRELEISMSFRVDRDVAGLGPGPGFI